MDETMMMHGQHYNGQDVSNWVATEKLDGVRAYWDGATMWTRGGKAIDLPDTWRETLPVGVHLDGELFAGYGNRQAAVNAARYGRFTDAVRFVAFDAPMMSCDYFMRLYRINSEYSVHQLFPCKIEGIEMARDLLSGIKSKGGEGLMLRHPDLEYMPGRTHLMLKLK